MRYERARTRTDGRATRVPARGAPRARALRRDRRHRARHGPRADGRRRAPTAHRARGRVIFKEAWLRRYWTVLPPGGIFTQSWDCAFKAKSDSDFVCGQVWYQLGARFYLVDQVLERLSFNETLDAIRARRSATRRRGASSSRTRPTAPRSSTRSSTRSRASWSTAPAATGRRRPAPSSRSSPRATCSCRTRRAEYEGTAARRALGARRHAARRRGRTRELRVVHAEVPEGRSR